MRRPGRTPPLRGADGRPLRGSIAEARFLRIGGVEQWVLIRGASIEAPPLVVLHGGPGFGEAAFFRHHVSALERSFTVVHWDQRGAGKSFDPRQPASALTVERLVSDLEELVETVCRRLSQPRVVILGHSWGSMLGPLYAARRPDRVAAYVGTGQLGDWAASEAASYAIAVQTARRRGARKALAKLESIGPPPHTAEQLWVERSCLQQLEGQLGPRAMLAMLRMMLEVPEVSLTEVPRNLRAFRITLDAMWSTVSRMSLHQLVPALAMPVFFLLGRRDHWVPPEISRAYFDALRAPTKEIVWFERSGHEPFVDEPERFVEVMEERVRPVLEPWP